MKDIQIKIGYMYLLMALPQLPFVGLELSPTLKEPLSAWLDNFDGDIYAIFMAFRVISATPDQNIAKFIDSQAAMKTVSVVKIYSHQNLSLSANNLSTYFFAPEERSFSNGSHLIAAFMEMNKLISWPKRLRRCIHLGFGCLFETPSDFSGTNFDRREFPLLQTWLLANLGFICLTAKDVFSFLSYLGWRVWHVSESSPVMINLQAHLFKIGLADSPLCKSGPMTGEHLSNCPALLHVLSQDNCGVLPARMTSALYWTARCLMSERTLAGVATAQINSGSQSNSSLDWNFKLNESVKSLSNMGQKTKVEVNPNRSHMYRKRTK
ncbi:hypothetical protein TNCV_569591 [Trichonephila clavipes]|nr:hypothetical protein TNCV_569591 [Trichonephila clavipes]